MTYIREACVESIEQALVAEENGADRIELCADLDAEGLTPSRELILSAKSHLNIPIRVMIRPRAGDFVYNNAEIKQMASDIAFCKEAGVNGVVLGILKEDKTINIDAVEKLAEIGKPMKFVFHKAIDETPAILESVKSLRDLGVVNGILTSGGENTASEGIQKLKNIIALAGDMEVICAGKITTTNLEELHREINAKAYHGKRIVSGLE
ncbi:copper homeostasis protein CutC [Salegentibacter mishustinae]|uniref:PF03932 family protein CutC n=1 Tax=Salegentibacter mishustinae TaxID=270918 RepID=A0A0Q9Z434_9FLAO|nr:copper homeostasis protein CutC [Salegentibacter mishustinae]KRG27611.1 copper homeostasis protein [Salegentibacter mishustinae]PNW20330.1 copper homeostasis protein [Salegentibacter mishustinae]PZX63114.1 copper homeostasis protein [Salegentibacter mishustinae]GGW91928.1 copper homeostasis protein CutC [Salegentibacter mishustinae]